MLTVIIIYVTRDMPVQLGYAGNVVQCYILY